MYTQSGRSMVEMLGVLAIIGVLSIGAIAGYSKAMMKYKLNKQAEQLNQLVNAVSQYHMQIHSENAISLVPIFKKLNVIPVEMIKDVSDTIYDIFGNEITITSYNYHGFYVANLNYYIDLSNHLLQLIHSFGLVNIAKKKRELKSFQN